MLRQYLLILIIGVLFLAACNSSDDPTKEPSSSDTPGGEITSPTETADMPPTSTDSLTTQTLTNTDQVNLTSTADASEDTSVEETGLITVWIVDSQTLVNYYECPLLTCDVAGDLPSGFVLDIINTEDDWHEIRLAGNERGFIEVRFTRSEIRETTPNAPTNLSDPPGVNGGTAAPFGSTTPPANVSPPPNIATTDPSAPTATSELPGPPNQPTLDSTFETPPASPMSPQ